MCVLLSSEYRSLHRGGARNGLCGHLSRKRNGQAMQPLSRDLDAVEKESSQRIFLERHRCRWGRLGTTPSQADEHSSSQGSTAEHNDNVHHGDNDGDGDDDGGGDEHSGVHVSPMCARCRYLTSHPMTPLPSTAASNSPSSLSLPSSSSAATAAATAVSADVTLGRYCLCTVNLEIQREVLQVCPSSTTPPLTVA